MTLASILNQATSVDNLHVAKAAGFIMLAIGLFFYFFSNAMGKAIEILGIVVAAIGAFYILFTIMGTMKLLKGGKGVSKTKKKKKEE